MTQPRYREDRGVACVDITVGDVGQLYDMRDPAPFRDRDLDDDLVEYLRGAAEDLLARPLRIVLWLAAPHDPADIETAYRAHFNHELERLTRTRRRHTRAALIGLGLAALFGAGLLSLSAVAGDAIGGSLGHALSEGLTISCWVLMWKPIEVLFYDWIPWRRERLVLRRLLAAPLEVRAAKPAPPAASGP